jgi:alkaline phosphatase
MLAVGLSASLAQADMAKNVILMISDGQGFNTVKATNMWNGAPAIYETFPYKFGVSTYDLGTYNATNPPSPYGYDPQKAWPNPATGYTGADAYNYLKAKKTDSASAATAMATGMKTYNGYLNYDSNNQPLRTITEIASDQGKSTGVVTSVEWSHATPAGFAAHNISRNNYEAIAKEMLDSPYLDVIMGAGNPLYNDNGVTPMSNGALTTNNPKYVGGATSWTGLQAGTLNNWNLITNKNDFQALADGTYNGGNLPNKVVGTVETYTTTQQARNYPANSAPANPSGVAFNQGVPSLATMTEGALNVLGKDPQGLFLMVEGGAVDWANHANQLGRMIEEQIGFNAAVKAAVDWVEANSNWKETLLLVTADHECGLLWGPAGDDPNNPNYFSSPEWNGKNILPNAQYFSGDHTNSLIPIYGIGAGADQLAYYADLFDPNLRAYFGDMFFDGHYMDNTEIFKVMAGATHAPIPGAVWLLGTGLLGLGLTGYRRWAKA